MRKYFGLLFVLLSVFVFSSCDEYIPRDAVSNGGVGKLNVTVQTQPDGTTVEQGNVSERIKRDNLPGSIKHLYVISTESGQVLLYSTVKGKVTSSGKRLTPSTVDGATSANNISAANYNWVKIDDRSYITNEVMGDDGTYGSSIEYLYWFDSRGVYHQHYKGGNEMLHISDQPLAVKSIILNLESR
jgi:hypothetical protein